MTAQQRAFSYYTYPEIQRVAQRLPQLRRQMNEDRRNRARYRLPPVAPLAARKSYRRSNRRGSGRSNRGRRSGTRVRPPRDWVSRMVVMPGQFQRISAFRSRGKLYARCYVFARKTVAMRPKPAHRLVQLYETCTNETLMLGGDTGRARPPMWPSPTARKRSGTRPSRVLNIPPRLKYRPRPVVWNPMRALPKSVITSALGRNAGW